MPKELIIVNKDLLPKCFEKVLKAKQYLENGNAVNVSEACQKVGISRSTFYKYQDDVFTYKENSKVRKLALSFTLSHKTGALSTVCDALSKINVSIITISQSAPIGNVCPVMLSLDISLMSGSIESLKKTLEEIEEVHQLKIMSFE